MDGIKLIGCIFFLCILCLYNARCNSPQKVSAPPASVVFIGFDAATWKIIDPLRAQGALPNLNKLIRNGVRAPLKTLVPTISPAVWTTIFTGMLPPKHGIDGFVDSDGNLYTSFNLRSKPLWEILSDRSTISTVINFWLTWPALGLKNVRTVSDRFVYPDAAHAVWPSDLLDNIPFQDVNVKNRMDDFGFRSPPARLGDE